MSRLESTVDAITRNEVVRFSILALSVGYLAYEVAMIVRRSGYSAGARDAQRFFERDSMSMRLDRLENRVAPPAAVG